MQNQRGRVIELRHEIGLRLRAKATARSHPSEQTLNKTLNKHQSTRRSQFQLKRERERRDETCFLRLRPLPYHQCMKLIIEERNPLIERNPN